MPRLSKIGAAALGAFGWTSGSAAVTASYLQVAGGGGGGFIAGGNRGAGGGAGTRLPQLYRVIDRVNNMEIAVSEAEMLERGSKPIIFNKKSSISFKPSLLQQIQFDVNQPANGGGQPLGITSISALNSTPMFNKWLPTQQSFGYPQAGPIPQIGDTLTQNATNPYALRYYGLTWFLAQDGAEVGYNLGQIQVRVTWEFKGARALKTNGPSPQLPAHPETSSQENGVVPNTQPTEYPGGH